MAIKRIFDFKNRTQDDLIKLVKSNKHDITDIKDGMCYALAMNLFSLYLYKENTITDAYNELTTKPELLLQSANEFSFYLKMYKANKNNNWLEKHNRFTINAIQLLTCEKYTADYLGVYDVNDSGEQIEASKKLQLPMKGFLVLFCFNEGHKTYSHAISVIPTEDAGKKLYYIYDPNDVLKIYDSIEDLYTVLNGYGDENTEKSAYIFGIKAMDK